MDTSKVNISQGQKPSSRKHRTRHHKRKPKGNFIDNKTQWAQPIQNNIQGTCAFNSQVQPLLDIPLSTTVESSKPNVVPVSTTYATTCEINGDLPNSAQTVLCSQNTGYTGYPPELPCSIEFTHTHLYIGVKLEDLVRIQYQGLFR